MIENNYLLYYKIMIINSIIPKSTNHSKLFWRPKALSPKQIEDEIDPWSAA